MKHVPLTLTCVMTLLAVMACANQRDAQPADGTAVAAQAVEAQAVEAPVVPPPADPTPDEVRAAAPKDFVKAQPTDQQPQLPSGHPDISKTQSPAAEAGVPQLPKGHPDIAEMMRSPSSQPAMIGTLAVRAVQGTKDGPAVGSAPVVVELYQKDQLIDKREGKLDEQGTARFDGIPVGLVVQPIVRVTYKGVKFETVGNVMDGKHPQQHVQVELYENTVTAPAWKVEMQHVMLQPSADGVGVMEMLVIDNPTDRVWIGTQPAGNAGAEAKRDVLTFPLPQDAKNVHFLGGLHDCCAKIEAGKLTSTMPLMPGQSQIRIDYTLPVKDGKAEFAVNALTGIARYTAFVPDDGTTVTPTGLEASGTADMGNGKVRLFKAINVAAGGAIKLGVSGITATTAAPAVRAAAGTSNASGQVAKVIAGVGGLVIFLVGGMFLLIKGPRKAKA